MAYGSAKAIYLIHAVSWHCHWPGTCIRWSHQVSYWSFFHCVRKICCIWQIILTYFVITLVSTVVLSWIDYCNSVLARIHDVCWSINQSRFFVVQLQNTEEKVKSRDIYILPLTKKPEQQQFTILSGILTSINSSHSGWPLPEQTHFGPTVCSYSPMPQPATLCNMIWLYVYLFAVDIYTYSV